MREIVTMDAVIPKLGAGDRDAVIAELLDKLIEAGKLDSSLREEVLGRILDRESKGSTGFGRGVAIPHVKHPDIKGVSAGIGVSPEGIDFHALDKQPVYSVFLLMSPEGDPEIHLRAMEQIFTNLSKDSFRRFLRQAETVEDVQMLLDDADNGRLPS
ncbi:MAG: PTS sugar transporter subunit IIA [Planctomycetota bacterium]